MALTAKLQRLSATSFALLVLGTGAALADCQSDFMTVRQEMEEKGKVLQAAGKAKATPADLCTKFRAFAAAEGKLAKFLADNKEWCQIPDEAIKAASANNKKTGELRDKICAAAANGAGAAGAGGPPKPPPQGSMSSALGVTTGYVPGQSGTGGGIFDTLNGNALKN